MSRKNSLVTTLAVSQSLATSFNSAPTVVRFLDNCSYQINVFTTNSIGTFQVQVSNDYYVSEANDSVVTNSGSWAALTLAGGVPTINAANDTIVINLNQLPFYAVRLSYISTTPGTGTCAMYISDKAIGG